MGTFYKKVVYRTPTKTLVASSSSSETEVLSLSGETSVLSQDKKTAPQGAGPSLQETRKPQNKGGDAHTRIGKIKKLEEELGRELTYQEKAEILLSPGKESKSPFEAPAEGGNEYSSAGANKTAGSPDNGNEETGAWPAGEVPEDKKDAPQGFGPGAAEEPLEENPFAEKEEDEGPEAGAGDENPFASSVKEDVFQDEGKKKKTPQKKPKKEKKAKSEKLPKQPRITAKEEAALAIKENRGKIVDVINQDGFYDALPVIDEDYDKSRIEGSKSVLYIFIGIIVVAAIGTIIYFQIALG